MKISNLIKGLAGGFGAGAVGALIVMGIATATGYTHTFLAILAGGMAGLGFGLLAGEKDRFANHVMGGAVGYAAIILAYLLIYISPISGHDFLYGSYTVVPAEFVSFWEFMGGSIMDTGYNILFIIMGIAAGSGAAYYIASKRSP
jgi:hypothetical protein